MLIKSSKDLKAAIADPAAAASDGTITVRKAVAGMAITDLPVAKGLRQITVGLTYREDDPTDLKSAIAQIEALGKSLALRAAEAEADKPAPPVNLLRIGGYATAGAVTGVGVGVILTELGKLGSQSGNPFLNAASIALGLCGAAAGVGVGTGVVHLEFDKLGVKAKTT